MIGKRDFIRIKDNSSKLFELSKQIKILRYLSWDKSVRTEFLNSKSEKIHKDLPKDDPKRRKPDISLANNKLNWMPLINLKEGLLRTIKYFKKLNEIN